jgi:4a-hydroxytetrahydrobiopterin dehydratase
MIMIKLEEKNCSPTKEGASPLSLEEKKELCLQIDPSWKLTHSNGRLHRIYLFQDFKSPLTLLQEIGEMAEKQWHHPEIFLKWGELSVTIWTHTIDDLVESDFIFAAKADQLFNCREIK